MKKILVVLLAVVSLGMLAGCDALFGPAQDPIVGTWNAVSYTDDTGTTTSFPTTDIVSESLVAKADNTLTFVAVPVTGSTVIEAGTWTLVGSTYYITIKGDSSMTFALSGNSCTITDYTGGVLLLTKS